MRRTRESTVTYYEWHVSRWLASDTRALLDPAGRGIYREALDLCYATGSIPKDPQLLARKLDCTEEQLRRVWPVISRHFRVDKKHPDTLTNRFADMFRSNFFTYLTDQKTRASKGGKNKNGHHLGTDKTEKESVLVPKKPNKKPSLYQQNEKEFGTEHKMEPPKANELMEMSSGGLSARSSLTLTTTTNNELTTTTTTTTNNNKSSKQQSPPLVESDWPLTAGAVCEEFPATDSAMLVSIIHSGVQAAVAADVAERLTDEVLAEAVRCAKRSAPKQNSSALFRKTVPEVIRNWARDAKAAKRA